MSELANNPELCESMGIAGRHRAIREFDWEKKVDQVLSIYQIALSEGQIPAYSDMEILYRPTTVGY